MLLPTPRLGPQGRSPYGQHKSSALQAHLVCVDEELLEELSELTGIEYRALCRAFVGEEKNLALDVVKTAVAETCRAR